MGLSYVMTVGEARGFAKVIGRYPHLSMLDQWGPDQGAIEVEPASGHSPMIVTIRNGDRDASTGHRPTDTWQVLKNGHAEQLTRGSEAVIA